MRSIDKIYIDGQCITPHGKKLFDLHNPATEEKIGHVRQGDEVDAQSAVTAAKGPLRPSLAPPRPSVSSSSAGCTTPWPRAPTSSRPR
jgi:hypothetical protein